MRRTPVAPIPLHRLGRDASRSVRQTSLAGSSWDRCRRDVGRRNRRIFNVAAPFNFSEYHYWVVFDTSGNGGTPDTMPWQNNYANYSIAVRVSGTGGSTSATPGVYERNADPGSPVTFQSFRLPSQQFQYYFNEDGSGTQFEVIFSRAALVAAMGPGAPQSKTWKFNEFTTQGNLQGQATLVDSLGRGGAVNPQSPSPSLDTTQSFDLPISALYTGNSIALAAQITSTEIANNPSVLG